MNELTPIKILEDAFEMGVNHGKGLWNDFPHLKKGMEAKLEAYIAEQNRLAEIRGINKGFDIASSSDSLSEIEKKTKAALNKLDKAEDDTH